MKWFHQDFASRILTPFFSFSLYLRLHWLFLLQKQGFLQEIGHQGWLQIFQWVFSLFREYLEWLFEYHHWKQQSRDLYPLHYPNQNQAPFLQVHS
uniref:Uncharacterized protein n=1 Tax=Lepeophtheirus salmonis TaxID=72036 RepID=A0A0K2VCU2_LEPSM